MSGAWRESAALLLLARHPRAAPPLPDTDYDVLVQRRCETASTYPSSLVFPGGVTEPSDFRPEWLERLARCGASAGSFDALRLSAKPLPIFEGDSLKRHVGLRIAAIRETFEELGILICNRNKDTVDQNNGWARALSDVDLQQWQKKVHNNPALFLDLCQILDCYPNVWALHFWNNWLTPSSYKTRFNTAFFMAIFQKRPPIVIEETEVAEVNWLTPEYIQEVSRKREVEIPPPQQVEMIRLLKHKNLDKLLELVSRPNQGFSEPYLPVTIKAKDGLLSVFPGDEMYPKNIDFRHDHTQTMEHLSLEELRKDVKTLHRLELTKTSRELRTNIENF